MTNFTKQQLKNLRNEMQGVLLTHPFEETIHIPIDRIHVGNCTYNGGEATYKVTVLLDGAETKEQKDLKDMAGLYNFDVDKIANTQGMKLKLVGYNSKAPKMPWIVKDISSTSNRNEYKLTNAQAESLFKKVEEVTQ